jgi:hypothetical protein
MTGFVTPPACVVINSNGYLWIEAIIMPIKIRAEIWLFEVARKTAPTRELSLNNDSANTTCRREKCMPRRQIIWHAGGIRTTKRLAHRMSLSVETYNNSVTYDTCRFNHA